VKAIAAVDKNWGIGKDGALLCPISADLKHFKALTMGHPVILGRRTLATFPGGRPLKGRDNYILSRDPGYAVEGAQVLHSAEEALAVCPEDSFVIGGESVYRALLDACDTVYITKIEGEFPADAWFPRLDGDPAWRETERSGPMEENGVRFRFTVYERVDAGVSG